MRNRCIFLLLFITLLGACGDNAAPTAPSLGSVSESVTSTSVNQPQVVSRQATEATRSVEEAETTTIDAPTAVSSPLGPGSTFEELSVHCDIADPFFGTVKLAGDLDAVGFAIPRSAANPGISPEWSADDLVPDRVVCLNTAPSEAVKGCGVVDWIGPDLTTAHAVGYEVTPVLFLAETIFTGAPTKLFGTCPSRADDRDPAQFDPKWSITVSPSPFRVNKPEIADIVDRVTNEFASLNNQAPLSLTQCESLAVLLERADAMTASVREMLGSIDELFPQQVFIDPSNSRDIISHRTSMRRPEFDASVFDDTSVSVSVDVILGINVGWEDLCLLYTSPSPRDA